MLLAEELVLLCMDDETGVCLIEPEPAGRGVAMALVFELTLRRTIARTDGGAFERVGPDTGDAVLDLAADRVAGHSPVEAVGDLVADDLLTGILSRLVARGVLHDAQLWSPGMHLPRDPHPEAGVRQRLNDALIGEKDPDRHDIALIALIHRVGLLPTIVSADELPDAQQRAEQIALSMREMDDFRRDEQPSQAQLRANRVTDDHGTPGRPAPDPDEQRRREEAKKKKGSWRDGLAVIGDLFNL